MDTAPTVAANPQARRIGRLDGLNLGVLDDVRAGFFGCAGQPRDNFSGIDGAAGHGAHHFQVPGIAPADRRILRGIRASQLVHTWEFQAGVDAQGA